MKQLDPKFVWMYYFSTSIGLVFLSLVLGLILTSTIYTSQIGTVISSSTDAEKNAFLSYDWMSMVLIFWLVLTVILFILNFIWVKLTWRFYRYELRGDGFRKEHGVIWKKYVTIPYERIQNVDIYRGLLARIFGLSDLNIQTAGMSTTVGSYGGGAEGRLPGLSPQVAEQLRDELIKRARGKHQGL